MKRIVAVAALVAISAANAEVKLNQLRTGEVADAEEVMGNFIALKSAIPFVSADSDLDPQGVSIVGDSNMQSINAVGLTVPSQGVLVASGSVYVNHYGPESGFYVLDLLIDGRSVIGHSEYQTWAAAAGVPGSPDGAGGGVNAVNIAFTITVPVSAGNRIIELQLGPVDALGEDAMNVGYFFNQNHLTVHYYPDSQAPFIQRPASHIAADDRSDVLSPFGR